MAVRDSVKFKKHSMLQQHCLHALSTPRKGHEVLVASQMNDVVDSQQ